MKNIAFTFLCVLVFTLESVAQINPVRNLDYSQSYWEGVNYFILSWDEPAEPHNELLGYNIYRDDDLFMFLEGETSIYHLIDSLTGEVLTNCGGEEFLHYNDGAGFIIHVTAMYLPGPVESGYDEVAIVEGMMIGIEDVKASKISVYPNPTTGFLNINHTGITKICIYNPIGAPVCEPKLQTPINLSALAKGMYIIEIEADDGRWSKKILLE